MHISQRNEGPSGVEAAETNLPAPLSRRGFITGVGAGLGLGVLAMTTIGATPAAAATHRAHCNPNVTYITMNGCWCDSPIYYCGYSKWCSTCMVRCGMFTEITGCC